MALIYYNISSNILIHRNVGWSHCDLYFLIVYHPRINRIIIPASSPIKASALCRKTKTIYEWIYVDGI